MKTLKTLLIILTVASLSACSSDDDNNTVENPNAQFAGLYNLTSLTAPMAVDFNMDETASAELMTESGCYNDTYILLNEDMTYNAVNSYVFFISDTGCQSEESSGTWEVNGNTLILTDTSLSDELELETEYTIDNGLLYKTEEEASYPDRDADDNPIYLTGTLYYTYTKV